MKIHLIILMCTILAFNNWANAQRDTVFFDIPELKVNNSYFLYDLDTMLLKFCYHCEENLVYVINIEQKREYIYLLNIKKTPLKYAKRNAKGFFKMDNTYFFVNGILPENPKKLFIRTDNHQQFYYVERVLLPDDFVIDIVEDCCSIMLEYRYEKLLFGDCK